MISLRSILLATVVVIASDGVAMGQAHEILRPTAEADLASTLGGQCFGTRVPSTAMPNSWDAAGLATSSDQLTGASPTQIRYRTRVFTPWATTLNTYTALTLNINSASGGPTTGGNAAITYSLDGGTTWTLVRNDGDAYSQVTSTVILSPGTNLTLLRVGICVGAAGDGTNSASDDLQIWDIWTDGTYTGGAGAGNASTPNGTPVQPIIISLTPHPPNGSAYTQAIDMALADSC